MADRHAGAVWDRLWNVEFLGFFSRAERKPAGRLGGATVLDP